MSLTEKLHYEYNLPNGKFFIQNLKVVQKNFSMLIGSPLYPPRALGSILSSGVKVQEIVIQEFVDSIPGLLFRQGLNLWEVQEAKIE